MYKRVMGIGIFIVTLLIGGLLFLPISNPGITVLPSQSPLPTSTPWPKNGLIKFTSGRDDLPSLPLGGGYYVYTMNADGSEQQRVTNVSVDNAWFVSFLAPDGKRIAFPSSEDGNKNIYVVDIDGSNLQLLTEAPEDDWFLSWSPDSQRIVFQSTRDSSDGNSDDIYVMNADGTGLNRLTDHYTDETWPSWSPDGKWISFFRDDYSKRELYIMDVNGRNVRFLEEAGNGDWSPDGQHILAGRYIFDVDTAQKRLLTANPLYGKEPEWSPDGTQIAFISVETTRPALYVINVDGTSLRRLTEASSEPSWSPDGKQIVFVCYYEDKEIKNYDICAIHADGTGFRRLTNEPGLDINPEWQPIWD